MAGNHEVLNGTDGTGEEGVGAGVAVQNGHAEALERPLVEGGGKNPLVIAVGAEGADELDDPSLEIVQSITLDASI